MSYATSTELTGGAGFTYEDSVVAYYLTSLLLEEAATPLVGTVKTVAVQQAGQGQPMDDIIVEIEIGGIPHRLSLQAKRDITISSAPSNSDFRDILTRAVETRRSADFNPAQDFYGFVVEQVAVDRFRTLNRLIEWAKSSPSGEHFATRYSEGGAAPANERAMREDLKVLIGATSDEYERNFYERFVALKLDGLTEGGLWRTEAANRLREIVAGDEHGQGHLLFDALCQLARNGAGSGAKWTRSSLINQLRGKISLRVIPNYRSDLDALHAFSLAGLADVSEDINGCHIDRPDIENGVKSKLAQSKLVNLSGLPGCGKSAILKRIASMEASRGPILFIKSDRIEGSSWATFATSLGLRHKLSDLLAEIGSAGTPILFIDGIDRVRPDQRGVIKDILRTIEEDDNLAGWKVLATSRDQGLEAYRAWFPSTFYRGSFIGDVSVAGFSDAEAEALAQGVPGLRRLLFGPASVSAIARRPFFAAVLAYSFPDGMLTPQTEVDLIAAWWDRAGHDAPEEIVPQRQRTLLDLAESGVRNLGKNVRRRTLKDATISHISGLVADRVIIGHDGNASYSFSHDIFFEWTFYRLLIELGDDWNSGLIAAGEPPLLGRVVGLFAQHALETSGKWSARYRGLEGTALRPQWRREWLTAPLFTPAFSGAQTEFLALLAENDLLLFEKLLVWFQAQHTVPSPIILQNSAATSEGAETIGLAELLGWPSDFDSWRRFLDWLLPLAPSLLTKLVPQVVEVFGVWQNVGADVPNRHSADIINACEAWLIELEGFEFPAELTFEYGRWRALGGEARSSLASRLRTMILRAARSYPAPAIKLFERAIANKRIRENAYSDLVGYTTLMAEVSVESVVALAKAELIQELPQERANRERREHKERVEHRRKLQAIPPEERTEVQKRALAYGSLPIGGDRYDLDDVGIGRHHSYYYPSSALHEPFSSLFAKRPEAALRLVRDLANHAVKGWRQVRALNQRTMGTPIPISVEFPWGTQAFWGDWHVYNWFMNSLAPQPLECAFASLSLWAFKEIEAGRPTADVIRSVVEGSECIAHLGLALVLALEMLDVSAASLPVASCQRLWEYDIARCVQEPSRNIDLFGFGFLSQLEGKKLEAKEFLDARRSRFRNVIELAAHFAFCKDEPLRNKFRAALARFPDELPFDLDEQRGNADYAATLRAKAERWAGLGDIQNYRKIATRGDEALIAYESPKPLSSEEESRLTESKVSLQAYSVIAWANKSLEAQASSDGIKLEEAISFAQALDSPSAFLERRDAGDTASQSAISAVAAVTISLDVSLASDFEWAWDVMSRVASMAEPANTFQGSKIPWHPCNHLLVALLHDRRSASPREDSIGRLFALAGHALEEVAFFAFVCLFRDPDKHVRWVAAQLAFDVSIIHRGSRTNKLDIDFSRNERARTDKFAGAVERLAANEDTPLPTLPPAWVRAENSSQDDDNANDEATGEWEDSDPYFSAQFAEKVFRHFPVESWCEAAAYREMWATALKQLVDWTSERLTPPWRATRRRSRDRTADLFAWNDILGDLIARTLPYFEPTYVRTNYLRPFFSGEEGLEVLSQFAEKTVARHVMDSAAVLPFALELLGDCVDRIIKDCVFDPKSHRAGEVDGHELANMISALLFVGNGKIAPGAARFANGEWSEIGLVMPLVTRLITNVGWSIFVMQKFMTLCQRAGVAYPIDAFALQINGALSAIGHSRSSWAGTLLPAKIAATIQRLADASFPLRDDQAQALLRALDALVDLGDRRSAALEQTEAFKNVRTLSA